MGPYLWLFYTPMPMDCMQKWIFSCCCCSCCILCEIVSVSWFWLKALSAVSGPAAKVEFKASPGGEVPTQTLFHIPPAVPDKIGEPGSGSAPPADGQQLFQQMSQSHPLKSPSPPPKPQLVYSNEVGKKAIHLFHVPLMARPFNILLVG